jgi:NitT/TauT family transport system ATP-binding protein
MAAAGSEGSTEGHSWSKLKLEHVSKEFEGLDGGLYRALHDVSLEIRRGDFYCLLGPSGCGKSTILTLIAGFDRPSGGRIEIERMPGAGGSPIKGPGTDRIMIFQDASAALFPWLNVEENVLFGPNLVGAEKDKVRERATTYLHMVGLHQHSRKFPFELSGGMKQRVQIARSLIMEPEVLLMDEPFAALDAITKRGLQQELARIWQETNKTVVYVTHDIFEALLLGTRVGVMTAGPEARIKKEVTIDLPRPRVTSSIEFVEAARQLEGLIEEEVNAPRHDRPVSP